MNNDPGEDICSSCGLLQVSTESGFTAVLPQGTVLAALRTPCRGAHCWALHQDLKG